MTVSLHVLGAAGTVTGSCFLFEAGPARVLVDCGMFQGPKTLKALNYQPFACKPSTLDAVVLTHAHIDHSGLLPKLIRDGFKGPVFATRGTRDLCSVMLPDSGHIQESEVFNLNRRNQRRGRSPVTPIYTQADAVAALKSFRAVKYKDWVEVAEGVRARFWNAGHILGSASVELEFAGQGQDGAALRVLLSGDLGPRHNALQSPAQAPPGGVDYLFCESTYGGTERPHITPSERRAHLAGFVKAANPGTLLMPAFAVERSQELIVDLIRLIEAGEIPQAPIFIDSPLAIRATEIFVRNASDLRGGTDIARIMRSPWLHFTETGEESRAIAETPGFKIILAGSGMCDAGRIRHHLKRWLWQNDTTVLLTGFQAQGTLGRLLLEGAREVRIQGDEISVGARIAFMDDYSGHADGPELAAWVAARQPVAGSLFLTHGESAALAAMGERVRASLPDLNVIIPSLDDRYELPPGGARPIGAAPHRLAPAQVAGLDWHNARSALLLDLSRKLEAAPDDPARAALLARLRAALEA